MIRTAVVAIALTVLCAGAQDLRRTSFRVNVTDKYGRSIGGLKPENFRVRVNDAETKVVAANIDEAPASVTILIDISDSITKRRRQWAITSAWKLISVANRNNEYSIIAFGKTVYPIAGWETPRDKIKSKLEELGNLKIGGGNTGLYDGVIAGIEKANSGNFGRKVLVVYSDGVDTASEAEWSNIKSKVRRSDLTVFCVATFDPTERGYFADPLGLAFLDEIAALGGGRAFRPYSDAESVEIGLRIADYLNYQYILEWETVSPPSDPKWRDVEIDASAKDAKGRKMEFKTMARGGFYPDAVRTQK